MKAISPEISPELLQSRKRLGIDLWDEMWEGELHMPPAPNRTHQDFQWEFVYWLRSFWAKPSGCRVHGSVNVASIGGWPKDFRVPDIVLLTPDRFPSITTSISRGRRRLSLRSAVPATNRSRNCRFTPNSACRRCGSSPAT